MPSEEITQSQEYHKMNNEEVSTNDTSITNNEATSSDSQGNASQLEEVDMTNTSTAHVQENTVPTVGEQIAGSDFQKPEKSLGKRAASVINRLTNVDSVKTGKGLRKLKNDTKSIVGEIDVEVSLEKEAAKGGDVVEVLASGQAVASWEGKLEKLNMGFGSINARAEYLSKESSSR